MLMDLCVSGSGGQTGGAALSFAAQEEGVGGLALAHPEQVAGPCGESMLCQSRGRLHAALYRLRGQDGTGDWSPHRNFTESVSDSMFNKILCLDITWKFCDCICQHVEELQKAQAEIHRLHTERDRYEDSMKKAFMRGVCALNIEALSMFNTGEVGRLDHGKMIR